MKIIIEDGYSDGKCFIEADKYKIEICPEIPHVGFDEEAYILLIELNSRITYIEIYELYFLSINDKVLIDTFKGKEFDYDNYTLKQ